MKVWWDSLASKLNIWTISTVSPAQADFFYRTLVIFVLGCELYFLIGSN